MAQGWISIHRQLQSHWLWEDKPFSRGQAWVDILMLANHDDNKFLLGNELVEVKCGSFITSELKLMERWGWSKAKVRSFLQLLEKDQMIVKKTDRKKTTITVENYGFFQDAQTTKRPQKNRKKTTKEPQKDTNNNVNNDNNNIVIYSDDAELNKAIISFVEFRSKIKKPMTEHAIELLITKLNKLSPDTKTQIEIINQSILRGWQGVFPLEQPKQEQKRPSVRRNSFNNAPQRQYDMDAMERLFAMQNNPAQTVDDDERLKAEADELQRMLQAKYAKSV